MKYVVVEKHNINNPEQSYSVFYPIDIVSIDYLIECSKQEGYIVNVEYREEEAN